MESARIRAILENTLAASLPQRSCWNRREGLEIQGRLYNAYAVDDNRGLCPNDWHVPTHSDWADLEMELGMSEVEANATGWRGSDQGSQLKASSSDTPSWNGTNSSQFSGLPGGYRSYLGNMVSADLYGVFWCQEMNEKMLGGIYDQVYSVVVTAGSNGLRSGFSVRCLKDSE